MRKACGILLMLMGAALVAGALLLFLRNQQEDQEAGFVSDEILIEIQEQIQDNATYAATEPHMDLDNVPLEMLEPEDLVMTEKEVRGYLCIGYITIPDLNLDLPVISDWSYPKLKVAPCRFSGTLRGEDLVVMAHSYKSHFGRLSELSEGAQVLFTDMDGKIWSYEVVATDILDPTAVGEMTSGEYDLTLFSCTPNGKHRVTVRCDKTE